MACMTSPQYSPDSNQPPSAPFGAPQPEPNNFAAGPSYAGAPPPQPVGPYAQPVYPGVPGAPDAGAPFGRDPYTGEPLSDKSKLAAGLLQIFLGGFGVGRFYIGDNKTGGIMLGLTILGWVTSILIVGIFIVMGVGIWALVDGIRMLTGSVPDANGLKLRA